MEHRHVSGVSRVAAEHAPRHDRIDRWFNGLHDPDLDRGGVGTQQSATRLTVVHVEGVVHVSGRVVGWKVESAEVVPLVLDLGALSHSEAHTHENVFEALPGLGDYVPVTEAATGIQFGQVEALGLQGDGTCACLQRRPAFGQ